MTATALLETPRRRLPSGLLAATIAVAGVAAVVAQVVGSTKAAFLLPIAAGALFVGASSALLRYRLFVLGLILIRPLLEATKFADGSSLLSPTTVASVALLVTAPLWLLAQRRETRLPLTPLTCGMVAVLGSLAVSTVASLHPGESAIQLLRGGAWVVMFFVVRRLADSVSNRRQLLVVIAASAALPVAIGLLEMATPGAGAFAETKAGVVRVRSTFDQSNDFGRYLMLLLLVGVAMLPAMSAARRKLLVAPLLVGTVVLGATYTRTAWLGLAVGLLVIAVMWRSKWILLLLGGGAALLLVLPQTAPHLLELKSSASATHATDDSASWRLGYWKQVAGLAAVNPVTGIGPNSTTLELDDAKEPHNEYLRAAVEGGAVGEAAYLFFLVVGVVAGVRAWRRRGNDPVDRAVGLGFAATVVAVAVAGVASNIVLGVSFMWYFAALGGIADRLTFDSQPTTDGTHRAGAGG